MGLMLALKSNKSSAFSPSARSSLGFSPPCTGRRLAGFSFGRLAAFSFGWFGIRDGWPLEDATSGVGYRQCDGQSEDGDQVHGLHRPGDVLGLQRPVGLAQWVANVWVYFLKLDSQGPGHAAHGPAGVGTRRAAVITPHDSPGPRHPLAREQGAGCHQQ